MKIKVDVSKMPKPPEYQRIEHKTIPVKKRRAKWHFKEPTPDRIARATAKSAYTEEQEREMLRLANDGVTCDEIAKRMGRTISGVRQKLLKIRREGITQRVKIQVPINRGVNCGAYGRPRFWTPERDAILIRLHNEGKNFTQIGNEFGKTRESVKSRWYAILKELNEHM